MNAFDDSTAEVDAEVGLGIVDEPCERLLVRREQPVAIASTLLTAHMLLRENCIAEQVFGLKVAFKPVESAVWLHVCQPQAADRTQGNATQGEAGDDGALRLPVLQQLVIEAGTCGGRSFFA